MFTVSGGNLFASKIPSQRRDGSSELGVIETEGQAYELTRSYALGRDDSPEAVLPERLSTSVDGADRRPYLAAHAAK